MKMNLFRKSFSKGLALSNPKGFTLIELLIVIAILGVLAAGILIAIDPVEQLARGRDAGRKSSISSLGRAIQTYYTANGSYPVAAAWSTTLLNSGEIKTFPTQSVLPTATTCTPPAGGTANMVGNFCYELDAPGATQNYLVHTHIESKLEAGKGTCAGINANTWYVYSSANGRAGTFCGATEPNPASLVLN